MSAEQSAAGIEPLLKLIGGSDDALAARAITTVATLPLDVDAWRAVDELVRRRLEESPSPETVRAAAHVPVSSVRGAVRAIAAGGQGELADAAFDGLVGAGDTDTISLRLEQVVERYGWPATFELPNDALARADLGRRPDDPDDALWWVVVAAKAGKARPVRKFIRAVRRGNGPRIFDGDPAYVASLLAPARPIPAKIAELLVDEWGKLDPLSEEARNVGILVEGLVGPDHGEVST